MGKTLYLLRHAKSSWDDPVLADHDRPLAPRGRRASDAIAEYLRAERITPALVLCSPSTRARQTLERIACGFGPGGHVQAAIEAGLYGATVADLLARLRNVPDEIDSVMLIGHDPALRDLALSLAGSGALLEQLRKKLPTAALATLTFPDGWHGLASEPRGSPASSSPRELRRP